MPDHPIPSLYQLAALTYRSPPHYYWNPRQRAQLEKILRKHPALILERRFYLDHHQFVPNPPRFNPCQWRILYAQDPFPTVPSCIGIQSEYDSAAVYATPQDIQRVLDVFLSLVTTSPIEAAWIEHCDLQPEKIIPRYRLMDSMCQYKYIPPDVVGTLRRMEQREATENHKNRFNSGYNSTGYFN